MTLNRKNLKDIYRMLTDGFFEKPNLPFNPLRCPAVASSISRAAVVYQIKSGHGIKTESYHSLCILLLICFFKPTCMHISSFLFNCLPVMVIVAGSIKKDFFYIHGDHGWHLVLQCCDLNAYPVCKIKIKTENVKKNMLYFPLDCTDQSVLPLFLFFHYWYLISSHSLLPCCLWRCDTPKTGSDGERQWSSGRVWTYREEDGRWRLMEGEIGR